MRLVPIRLRAATMHFKPIFSFSIHRFDYDTNSHRLLVHYYDGRQAICSHVPPIVVAVLRASSQPEIVLQRYAKPRLAGAQCAHEHFVC
jgi:hypothetical protein